MEILNRHQLASWPPGAIYVGRGHPLGNPYQIGPDGTREEVIEKCRAWFESCLRTGDTRIIEAFRYLREDSTLVCSCVPKPCHAEVIREIWYCHFRQQRPLVWVFGNDLKGQLRTPSARFAQSVCGAIPRQSEGPQQAVYAIPILDPNQYPLPLPHIALAVHRFLEHARQHPNEDFKCGELDREAGYPPPHLAPLFATAPHHSQLPAHWQEAMRPYRNLGQFPIRLAVIGRSDLNQDSIRQRLDHLTSRLNLAEVALLCRDGEEIGELAQSWARRLNIPCFVFPAYWREIHVPHARIRHGSVGRRYNIQAGEDSDARILANATHAVILGNAQQSFTLAQAMRIKLRVIRSDKR